MNDTIAKSKPMNMKLSLKKETLCIIDDSQLEPVVGGFCFITCGITGAGNGVVADDKTV